MRQEMIALLAGVGDRLLSLAEQDDELRSRLRALAQAVLALTERPPVTATAGSDPFEGVSAGQILESLGPPAAEQRAEIVPGPGPVERAAIPLVVREGKPAAAVARDAGPGFDEAAVAAPPPAAVPAAHTEAVGRGEVTDADLPLMEDRLRLKAEGARWAATRRRRMAQGADFRIEIEPLDREIIEKAKKLPDCFLWMCHPSGPAPADLSLLDDLAGCFEATADAVGLVRGVLNDAGPDRAAIERSLELLAEAQSALRAAVGRVDAKQDKDQLRAYLWLRATCWNLQCFVARYMKIEDVADPASWADIDRRIEELDSQLQQSRRRAKAYQSSLKRIRYHLKLIAEGGGGEGRHDWQVVIDTVGGMVADGVPPSNADIRELLLPVIDGLPDDLEHSPGFSLVLREIDRFLATRPAEPDGREAAAVEPTAEVKAVADLLRGRTVVLIGGLRRRDAHEALERAFGLKELDWIETREHESVTSFEPHVAGPTWPWWSWRSAGRATRSVT